jgi:hypothetical protein
LEVAVAAAVAVALDTHAGLEVLVHRLLEAYSELALSNMVPVGGHRLRAGKVVGEEDHKASQRVGIQVIDASPFVDRVAGMVVQHTGEEEEVGMDLAAVEVHTADEAGTEGEVRTVEDLGKDQNSAGVEGTIELPDTVVGRGMEKVRY